VALAARRDVARAEGVLFHVVRVGSNPFFFLMGRDPGTMQVSVDYREGWQEVPDAEPYKNPYRFGWEGFIRHVAAGTPFDASFAAGIRDVQLAEACQRSAGEGRWIGMPQL